jgi:hypothetical protein
MVTMAGYSGTPLAKKLGIKEGHTVAALAEPNGFRDWLAPLPDGARLRKSIGTEPDVVIVFATKRAVLERNLLKAADAVYPDGAVWAAWPKKSSKVPTDITEDTVREIALPRGLVDNKVCAVSEVWSGLRVVWRRELRCGDTPPRIER